MCCRSKASNTCGSNKVAFDWFASLGSLACVISCKVGTSSIWISSTLPVKPINGFSIISKFAWPNTTGKILLFHLSRNSQKSVVQACASNKLSSCANNNSPLMNNTTPHSSKWVMWLRTFVLGFKPLAFISAMCKQFRYVFVRGNCSHIIPLKKSCQLPLRVGIISSSNIICS